jgi:hypothetical protein
MNYIKIIDVEESKAEAKINGWLKEIDTLGHRVLSSRVHFYKLDNEWVKILFVVNDEPRKKQK